MSKRGPVRLLSYPPDLSERDDEDVEPEDDMDSWFRLQRALAKGESEEGVTGEDLIDPNTVALIHPDSPRFTRSCPLCKKILDKTKLNQIVECECGKFVWC